MKTGSTKVVSEDIFVVDKSKMTECRNGEQHLSPDPAGDQYCVVDKSKPDPTTLTEDTYEAVPTENLYYNTVAATTNESATLYDSASATTYSNLDHAQVHSAVVNNPKKQTPAPTEPSTLEEKHIAKQTQEKIETVSPFCMLACFAVLIIAVIAAAVAVAIALVLIAGLRSDLTAALNDSSSSPGSSSENVKLFSRLEDQLNQLQNGNNNFTAIVNNELFFLNQNVSGSLEDLSQQINSMFELLRELKDKVNLLTSNVNALEGNFSGKLNEMSNNTITKLQNLNNQVVEEIMNTSSISLSIINTLTDKIASGIQDLHYFDSCESVANFPISLPSGMYRILSSGNTSIDRYCSTTITLFCNGIPGRWKRIAYLNTYENLVMCPDGFEVRSDTSNPPLCRRTDTIAGCSSVIYPSNGVSYSQVCGTVQVHPEGSPDSFLSVNHRIPRNGQSVNQNYVDGVSLTYGDSPNRNHIWTYTAAITVRDDRRGCDICDFMKPSFIGTDFTCYTAYCDDLNNCYPSTLWGNASQQCLGNETFYRQLSESTTDNVEMRVCRDQDRSDEDILISYVEIYVNV